LRVELLAPLATAETIAANASAAATRTIEGEGEQGPTEWPLPASLFFDTGSKMFLTDSTNCSGRHASLIGRPFLKEVHLKKNVLVHTF